MLVTAELWHRDGERGGGKYLAFYHPPAMATQQVIGVRAEHLPALDRSEG